MSQANLKQVGGTHYQSAKQHWDVILETYGPGYVIGCATKYVTRWRKKNGLEDLAKAAHYIEKLIEWSKGSFGHFCHLRTLSSDELAEFAQANALTDVESRVVALLTGKFNISDLHEALGLVQRLIEENQPQPDNTGMKQPFGYQGE